MSRIESLTDAQIAKFPEYVKRWTDIGLCTDPADKPRAEAAIVEMYRQGGLKPPNKIVWCGSPLSNGLVRAIILDKKMASVRASVRDSVRASVWDSVWDSVYGQHEAGWLAFYRYFHAELALVGQTEKLDGLWELAQSCGWILPCQNICFASERHNVLHRDTNGRLHCETGPAVAYPDGFAIHAWHGQTVPVEWIEKPESLSPQIALGQQDTALRIAAMQIIGWPRMIEKLSAKVVNRHPEGLLGGELLAVSKSIFNPDERGTMKFLRAECPRNGIICFRVPDETKTAHEAQAWKAGLPPDLYQLPSTRT